MYKELSLKPLDDLDGVGGVGRGERLKRKGIYVYTWLTHGVEQQKLTQHYIAIIPVYKNHQTVNFKKK